MVTIATLLKVALMWSCFLGDVYSSSCVVVVVVVGGGGSGGSGGGGVCVVRKFGKGKEDRHHCFPNVCR